VRRIGDGLPPGIAVAGAALHGVGVPACIGTARSAAGRLAGQLAGVPPGSSGSPGRDGSMEPWPVSTTPR
jgi:oxygen-dependent protoporphyrinogen oxidase